MIKSYTVKKHRTPGGSKETGLMVSSMEGRNLRKRDLSKMNRQKRQCNRWRKFDSVSVSVGNRFNSSEGKQGIRN